MKSFYITTAIDYPNGMPHIGHMYEKIIADCYVRWYRFLQYQTYFLTGTDENGQKLAASAKAQGKGVRPFVDENVIHFKELCKNLQLSHNDFIRTSEERHRRVCRELWQKLSSSGDIYFDSYKGEYCLSCENFYSEAQAHNKMCPHHQIPLEHKEEQGYFFKMSRYESWIIDYHKKHSHFVIPERFSKELVDRLSREGVKDVPFSRPNEGWGIEVPGDDKFVMYTWADALVSYYSSLVAEGKESFWPANVHVIGKDIVWFHCVIWPCMLKALELPLPAQVFVHGMVLGHDGRKMSKTLGNGVDPGELLAKYPIDTIRYYFLRHIPAQEDGNFSEKELNDKHRSELANDYGNLIMRVFKLALKHLGERVKGNGVEQKIFFEKTFHRAKNFMNAREHGQALGVLWQGVKEVNAYINRTEPWKCKDNPEKLRPIIYNCCYSIHTLALYLSPFLPDTSALTISWLGPENSTSGSPCFGKSSYRLSPPKMIFPPLE